MSVSASASEGSRLETLRSLRDRIAGDIDVCESARDVAALSQRLMDVLEQIDVLVKAQPAQKGTVLDELAARRSDPVPTPRPARSSRRK